jgi:hypothetical protein
VARSQGGDRAGSVPRWHERVGVAEIARRQPGVGHQPGEGLCGFSPFAAGEIRNLLGRPHPRRSTCRDRGNHHAPGSGVRRRRWAGGARRIARSFKNSLTTKKIAPRPWPRAGRPVRGNRDHIGCSNSLAYLESRLPGVVPWLRPLDPDAVDPRFVAGASALEAVNRWVLTTGRGDEMVRSADRLVLPLAVRIRGRPPSRWSETGFAAPGGLWGSGAVRNRPGSIGPVAEATNEDPCDRRG